MSNLNTADSFEADLRTVRRAAHLQRGRIVTTPRIETDRWDFEDVIAASERLTTPAEKYQRMAAILENLLPRLEDICFSDISVTENIAALRDLTSAATPGPDEQLSL